jgi:nucleoside-diphosphate-sugar epimerase
MKVLITGVNGFIANNLAKFLNEKQIEVYGTSSRDIANHNCIKTFTLKIGDDFSIENIKFDWVIHCVYDKNLSIKENTKSTIDWATEFQKKDVKNQIFISSISAISGNNSEYSLIKQKTEQWFLSNNMNVIRPGLVVGDGGLFKQMIKKVISFPVMPLVNAGNSDVKLIGIKDLISKINNILDRTLAHKEINIFYSNKFILKDVLIGLSKFYGKKIFFINIPFFIIFSIVKVLEILKINIGVTSQNIKGLVSNETDIKCGVDLEKDILQILEENLRNPFEKNTI